MNNQDYSQLEKDINKRGKSLKPWKWISIFIGIIVIIVTAIYYWPK